MSVLTGCTTEGSLAEAASNGDVEAQFELAIYYSELETPQKNKAFDWMKRAAGSRYVPAMKKLAAYYLRGYGTPVDYQLAAEWLRRYFDLNRDSAEALENGRQILVGASKRVDIIAGFSLFRIAIMIENQDGRGESEVAKAAAAELMTHTSKVFGWLLAARNYTDAKKLLDYSASCQKEYPVSFAPGAAKQLTDMRQEFFKRLEN